MMEQPGISASQDQLVDMSTNTMIQVVLLGVILGAIAWIVTLILDRFLITPLFCGDATSTLCTNSDAIAGNIALILASVGGLLGLVRLGVYRPLLIAIAAAIVLWGMAEWVGGLMWYESLAWTVALYALCYAAFTWLVRPRLFLIAVILVLLVVFVARILPVYS